MEGDADASALCQSRVGRAGSDCTVQGEKKVGLFFVPT